MNPIFNKKSIIAAVCFSSVIAAIFFAAVIPMVEEIGKVGEQLAGQREKIAGYEKRIAAVREFAIFSKAEKANLDKISNLFIDDIPLNFVDFLETAARDSSVEVEFSSSPSPAATDMIFEASIDGKISGIINFIKNIETGPYLVDIQTMGLKVEAPKKKQEVFSGQNATTTLDLAMRSGKDFLDKEAQAHVLLKAYAKAK